MDSKKDVSAISDGLSLNNQFKYDCLKSDTYSGVKASKPDALNLILDFKLPENGKKRTRFKKSSRTQLDTKNSFLEKSIGNPLTTGRLTDKRGMSLRTKQLYNEQGVLTNFGDALKKKSKDQFAFESYFDQSNSIMSSTINEKCFNMYFKKT